MLKKLYNLDQPFLILLITLYDLSLIKISIYGRIAPFVETFFYILFTLSENTSL